MRELLSCISIITSSLIIIGWLTLLLITARPFITCPCYWRDRKWAIPLAVVSVLLIFAAIAALVWAVCILTTLDLPAVQLPADFVKVME